MPLLFLHDNNTVVLLKIFYLRMSREAAEILQKFYLNLRDRNTSADGTPVTARQLESLVRLAQARARVDLREEITVKDAMASYSVCRYSKIHDSK